MIFSYMNICNVRAGHFDGGHLEIPPGHSGG